MSRVCPQACRNLNYVSLKHTRWSGSLEAVRPCALGHTSCQALSASSVNTPFCSPLRSPNRIFHWHCRGLLAPNGSHCQGCWLLNVDQRLKNPKEFFWSASGHNLLAWLVYFPMEGKEATNITSHRAEALPHYLSHPLCFPSEVFNPGAQLLVLWTQPQRRL